MDIFLTLLLFIIFYVCFKDNKKFQELISSLFKGNRKIIVILVLLFVFTQYKKIDGFECDGLPQTANSINKYQKSLDEKNTELTTARASLAALTEEEDANEREAAELVISTLEGEIASLTETIARSTDIALVACAEDCSKGFFSDADKCVDDINPKAGLFDPDYDPDDDNEGDDEDEEDDEDDDEDEDGSFWDSFFQF